MLIHFIAAAWLAAAAPGSAKVDPLVGCGLVAGGPPATSAQIVEACTLALKRDILADDTLSGIYNNRANAYVQMREYDKAFADLARAIHYRADDQRVYVSRGTLYCDLGEYDRALEDFNTAIRLFPQYATAYSDRGGVYFFKGDYDRAIADYDRAIKLAPKYVEAYTNRGDAYYRKGDYDRAIAGYDRAIELAPKYLEAYVGRSSAYDHKGDYDHAIADIDRAVRLTSQTNAEYLNRACWIRAKFNRDLSSARTFCDAALRLSNNDPEFLNSRGLVSLHQQRWADAWADYDAAVHDRPENASDFYGRGIAALRLGRTAEGQADLAEAAKLSSEIAEIYASYGVKP